MFQRNKVEYKSLQQIRVMREAGLVVAAALEAAQQAALPGTTTARLNDVAAKVIADAGALPSFLGYGHPPFPGAICTSVNNEVVHGLPGQRVLEPGDLVSVDCGAIVRGWHGDAARTFVVPGAASAATAHRDALVTATYDALWDGIAAVAVGERLGAVGAAIEDSVGDDYGIVEEYTGHGIGSSMHMPPDVLNYRTNSAGMKMKPGLCIAIEPMITSGAPDTMVAEDEWTVVTVDGGDAAHWEHTVALTADGPVALTAVDGGKAELAQRGVQVASLD